MFRSDMLTGTFGSSLMVFANGSLYLSIYIHEVPVSQGEKNVQPDRDPRNTVLWLYRLSYAAAYTPSPLNSEQFWTVTPGKYFLNGTHFSNVALLLFPTCLQKMWHIFILIFLYKITWNSRATMKIYKIELTSSYMEHGICLFFKYCKI
jgi:hypothetical protein